MTPELVRETVDRLTRVPGVRGALVVDALAGVPVAADLMEGVDARSVAAVAASLFRRTDGATEQGALGRLHALQLDAAEGHLIVAGGENLVIAVVAYGDAQLGRVRLEAHRAAEALA